MVYVLLAIHIGTRARAGDNVYLTTLSLTRQERARSGIGVSFLGGRLPFRDAFSAPTTGAHIYTRLHTDTARASMTEAAGGQPAERNAERPHRNRSERRSCLRRRTRDASGCSCDDGSNLTC